MELSILTIACLVAAVVSLISIVLSARAARRISSAKRAAVPGAELIAAIMAAVSASMGKPASGMRIVSIEATGGFTTPVWGHAERTTRGPYSRNRG
jgi:hypothetical protein